MRLILVGASVRAACYSALRAGFEPFGIDLFGDQDLVRRFPAVRVPPGEYPHGLAQLLANAPDAPWVYTGGLENRRGLLRRLAAIRLLLGNPADVVARVRRPERLAALLADAGFAVPRLGGDDTARRWLVKPRRGSAGVGVRFWDPARGAPDRRFYLQEFIEGEPHSALFVGAATGAWLAGVTRQLIGLDWLGSRGFNYCGNVGPITLPMPVRKILQGIGDTLAARVGLRGVFGVDFVLAGKTPYTVEVNPRYTASVEVLEKARKVAVLHWHSAACRDETVTFPTVRGRGAAGKAILYARRPVCIPADWSHWLPLAIRGYADIPAPGTEVEAQRPILSILVTGNTANDCLDLLRIRAEETYRMLEHG